MNRGMIYMMGLGALAVAAPARATPAADDEWPKKCHELTEPTVRDEGYRDAENRWRACAPKPGTLVAASWRGCTR